VARMGVEEAGVVDRNGRLRDKALEEILLVRTETERLAAMQGQHTQEGLLKHDGDSEKALQSAYAPPPVKINEALISENIRDLKRTAMRGHPTYPTLREGHHLYWKISGLHIA
jgi:hypothetical protein